MIGQAVASGQMPPRGGLSAEQKAIVASWVSHGCPETAADAALLCESTSASAAADETLTPNPDSADTPPARPRVGDDGEGDEDDREESGDDD